MFLLCESRQVFVGVIGTVRRDYRDVEKEGCFKSNRGETLVAWCARNQLVVRWSNIMGAPVCGHGHIVLSHEGMALGSGAVCYTFFYHSGIRPERADARVTGLIGMIPRRMWQSTITFRFVYLSLGMLPHRYGTNVGEI